MYVYFVKSPTAEPTVKIGKSAAVANRLARLQVGSPVKLELLGVIKCRHNEHALEVEGATHAALDAYRVNGEWFSYTPEVEKHIAELLRFGAGDPKRLSKAERAKAKAAQKARALAHFKKRLAEEPKVTGVPIDDMELIQRAANGDLDVPRVTKIGDRWYANGSDLALYRLDSQALPVQP